MQRSFATVKSERTIATLAKRLFDIQGASASEAQKIAEAALLRANPELVGAGGFKPGRIVVVPSDTGLKPTDRVTAPEGGVEGALADTAIRLKLAGQLLDDELEKDAAKAEKSLSQLADDEFVAQLRKAAPEGARLIPDIRKAIEDRTASNARVKAQFASALEQGSKELERLMTLAKRDR